MNSKTLISIIIPAYNVELYIKKTIESVLNQTYDNFEILVIDDGSSDKTLEIVKSFNDKRIKIFQNEGNKGAAYSRNRGIQNASGEYIAFLDGDDIWYPEKLEKQLNFMIENDYSFSSTNFEMVNENDEGMRKYVFCPNVMTHKDFLKTCYISTITVMYKKDICPDLNVPTSILNREDYALWIKLSEKCNCYNLNLVLSKTIRRQKSLSSISKSKLFPYHIIVFKELYNFNSCKAFLFALRNVFYYFIRKIKYTKKINPK